jgi:uncharacterized protein
MIPGTSHELIQRMFGTIDRRDWSALGQFFAPNIVYERPGYSPLAGLAALDEFYQVTRMIGSGQHWIEHIVSGPDAAACWGVFVGTSRDGKPLKERFADVYEIRSGLVIHRVTHFFRPSI